ENSRQGGKTVCAFRLCDSFLCPVCFWHARHRRAAGRRFTDAVAEVCDCELPGGGTLGEGDFNGGIFIRPALEPAYGWCEAPGHRIGYFGAAGDCLFLVAWE